MSNKELFINSYLNKIAEKFNLVKNDGQPDLDKAFEIFSIASFTDKSFDEVHNDVIIKNNGGGKGADGGIDGIYLREQDNYYLMDVFQCKNSRKLKQNELEKFSNDFHEVFELGKRNKPNTQGLIPKLDEYVSITKDGYRIEHRLFFIFNGDFDDNQTSNKQLFDSYNKPHLNFFIYDSNDLDRQIERLVKSDSKRDTVRYSFDAEKSNLSPKEPQALITYSILNVKAVNFRTKALNICALMDEEQKINGTDDKLFSENIRGFLGYNKTNRKIKETLLGGDSIYFPFLNNGITIIADEIQIPNSPQAGFNIIPTVNPVIVNGLQTSKVIYNIYSTQRNLLEDVYVTIKLYETKDPVLIDRITEATNTQSPINFSDKISNKDFHTFTKQLFENNNIAYTTKRGEVFTNKLALNLNETIASERILKFWYAIYYEKPEIAKNSISKVIEDVFDATNQESPLSGLFNGSKDSTIYLQLLNTYYIQKFVIAQRIINDTDDFIEHADELLSYGVYKHAAKSNLRIEENNLQPSYDFAFNIIKENVINEKQKRQNEKKTYSHSSYFKSAQCRIEYNQKAGIAENYDLISDLMK